MRGFPLFVQLISRRGPGDFFLLPSSRLRPAFSCAAVSRVVFHHFLDEILGSLAICMPHRTPLVPFPSFFSRSGRSDCCFFGRATAYFFLWPARSLLAERPLIFHSPRPGRRGSFLNDSQRLSIFPVNGASLPHFLRPRLSFLSFFSLLYFRLRTSFSLIDFLTPPVFRMLYLCFCRAGLAAFVPLRVLPPPPPPPLTLGGRRMCDPPFLSIGGLDFFLLVFFLPFSS